MNADEFKAGGSGVCKFCGEAWPNVAFHSSNKCRKNPDLADMFKKLDEENRRKIMGEFDDATTDPTFLNELIDFCNKHDVVLHRDESTRMFRFVRY